MLTHPRKNISEIATGCGFADASRLGRKFRRVRDVAARVS
ncbi:hypothetical protein [Burkholderia ambifaria]